MARKPLWGGPDPAVPVWPPDRFEVRCAFPAPDPVASDRYHFAKFAHEAASRIRDVGFARQIQVIRLSDGAVLFDLMSAREVPIENW